MPCFKMAASRKLCNICQLVFSLGVVFRLIEVTRAVGKTTFISNISRCEFRSLVATGTPCVKSMEQASKEGDLQLVGSDRAFEGRLMIEHNGVLRTVCFDDWTYQDASAACRQLGYGKGAMITRANDGAFAGSAATPTIRAPGCTAGNNRLSHCSNFQYREDLSCTSEVDLSCYVNDFEGCHSNPPGTWIVNQLLPQPGEASTIERCLGFCRESNSRFAALAELRCLCGPNMGTLGPALPTESCAMPCTGDPTAACGQDIDGTQGNFAVWPVAVGALSADVATADGCFYSPGFPGRYPTTDSPATHEYRVTLPTTAFVSFTVKNLDLDVLDSVRVQDRTAGSAMTTVDVATFGFNRPVVPFAFKPSKFALIFSIDAQSPNEQDYGYLICYKSLENLPPDSTTPPPTAPPTNPPTNAPTAPPANPTTNPPVPTVAPTNPQPPTQLMASPGGGTTARAESTAAPVQAVTSLAGTVAATTEGAVARSTVDTVASTDGPQEGDMCPLYHGAPVENRSGRGEDEVLLLNTGNPFNCTGFITHVRYYSASNHKLNISVWHPEHLNAEILYRYVLAGEAEVDGVTPTAAPTAVPTPGGVVSVPLRRDDWLQFRPGDVLGLRVRNSPLVYSNVPVGDIADIPWRRWSLDDADQYGSENMEVRNTSNAAELNRTYSISATLRAKRRCYIPIVSNTAFTDAIVPFVYEAHTYILDCAPGYSPEGGNAFFCYDNGTFNRELRCVGGSLIPGLNFTVLVMCLVILVLLCLTIFVVACGLVCCRVKPDEAGKASTKKPVSRRAAPKAPRAVVAATAIPISEEAISFSDQTADQAPILSDTDDAFLGNDYQLNVGAEDMDRFESNRPTVPPPPPPEAEPAAVDSPDAAAPEVATPGADTEEDGAPVINNPIHVDALQ